MILAGIVYAAFTGNLPAVTDAALDAAQQAVTLCITMAGVLAFWVGLMRIAENAGMMQRAADRKMCIRDSLCAVRFHPDLDEDAESVLSGRV